MVSGILLLDFLSLKVSKLACGPGSASLDIFMYFQPSLDAVPIGCGGEGVGGAGAEVFVGKRRRQQRRQKGPGAEQPVEGHREGTRPQVQVMLCLGLIRSGRLTLDFFCLQNQLMSAIMCSRGKQFVLGLATLLCIQEQTSADSVL